MSAFSSTSPVVLITGCSSGGIGFHLALAFSRAGCRVVATARRLDSMRELAPLGVTTLELDVTSPDSIAAAVQQTLERVGRIDILVNNAGMPCVGPLVEVDLSAARAAFDANYWGLLAVTQAVVPHMAARHSGTVVNIGSIAGWIPSPFGGVYASSKAAVESLTHTLRLELRPFGIRTMLVCPGAIKSNIGSNGLTKLDTSRYVMYRPYAAAVAQRAGLSQESPTPTDVFADRVVSQALRRGGPPRVLAAGFMSGWVALLRRLPYWLQDLLLAHRFGVRGPAPAFPALSEGLSAPAAAAAVAAASTGALKAK